MRLTICPECLADLFASWLDPALAFCETDGCPNAFPSDPTVGNEAEMLANYGI